MIKMLISVFVLLLMVSGCATQSPEAELTEKRPLGRSYETFVPPSVPEGKPVTLVDSIDASGELTLEKASALALLHNPKLGVFAWSIRAAQARQLQSGLWPNPELDVELENIGGSGSYRGTGNAETTVGMGQRIEVRGKRAKRARIAALESRLAAWDYEAQRLAVFTEVAQAFSEVLAAQERIRVVNQQVDLAEKVVRTVEQRVQAGKDSPLEATKARISLTQAHIHQKRLQRELAASRQTLVATWGGSEVLFTEAQGAFDQIIPPPEISVMQPFLMQHPTIARWETEIDQRQASIDLAKANAVPDPTLVGGYRHFNEVDASAFVLGLSLPLPVTNRNQGNILEAKVALTQARRQREAALAGIRVTLSRAYADLSSAHMTASDLKRTVLPGAQEAFDSAQVGYQDGKFDYLTVLDAQRTFFAARTQYVDSLADYYKARAQVEHLIGQSLETLEGQNHD